MLKNEDMKYVDWDSVINLEYTTIEEVLGTITGEEAGNWFLNNELYNEEGEDYEEV